MEQQLKMRKIPRRKVKKALIQFYKKHGVKRGLSLLRIKRAENAVSKKYAESEQQHKKKVAHRKNLGKQLVAVFREKGKRGLVRFIAGLPKEDQQWAVQLLASKGLDIDLKFDSEVTFSDDPYVDHVEKLIQEAAEKLRSQVGKRFLVDAIVFTELLERRQEEIRHYREAVKRGETPKRLPDSRVGVVRIKLPKNVLFIRRWSEELGGYEYFDASEFFIDQTRGSKDYYLPWRLPPKGDGTLLLWLREDNSWLEDESLEGGRLYVRLPQTKTKRGYKNPWAVKPPLSFGGVNPSPKFNEDLEAAITAYLRVWEGSFEQYNPRNRVDYGDFSCVDCRHARWGQVIKDETDWESAHESNSPYVYGELDVNYTAAFGNMLPKLWCPFFGFLDYDLAKEVNAAKAQDLQWYLAEDRRMKRIGNDEVLLGGEVVKMKDARHKWTQSKCKDCPFFHRKTGKLETARVEKQAVQTLTSQGWKLGAPGEFRNPKQFRIVGIGGIIVQGTDEIFAARAEDFVPQVEALDPELEARKAIRDVWNVAFNIRKIDESVLQAALNLIQNPPKMSEKLLSKWEKAKVGLARAILWAREDQPIPDFPIHFFPSHEGVDGDFVTLRVQDVLSEFLHQAEAVKTDGLHALEELMERGDVDDDISLENVQWDVETISFEEHDIRTAKELSYRLDFTSEDYIVQAVEDGVKFVLVDDWGVLDEAGMELVAAALQYKLQKKIEDFVWDCRRAQDPHEVLKELLLTEETKAFILEHSRKAQG